jgi:hypothetical protein
LVFTFLLGATGEGDLLPVSRNVHSFFIHSKLGPWRSWGWLGMSGMFPSFRGALGRCRAWLC